MSEIDKKIRKGLPPRRDVACIEVGNDIVIPRGTILRAIGDDKFACAIGLGTPAGHAAGEFVVTVKTGDTLPAGALKRVVAS